MDGCSTEGKIVSTQSYDASSRSAEVQCCTTDGQSCLRKNPSEECWTGDKDGRKVSWYEAYDLCSTAGYRLCNSQEELNRCCLTGCNYDHELTWTSLQTGTKL